jgi:hypothetical protein
MDYNSFAFVRNKSIYINTKLVFATNRLALNLNEMNTVKFTIDNSPQYALIIAYNEKHMVFVVKIEFLGLANW